MKLNSMVSIGCLSVLCAAGINLMAASANAFSLSGSSGTWGNTVVADVDGDSFDGYSYLDQNLQVGSENQVRWGAAATEDPNAKSGLGFTGVGASNLELNQVFQIGALRHFNNPVYLGTQATSTALTVNLNFAELAGAPLSKSFTFDLGIDETPNSGELANCPYISISAACSDKIFFPSALPAETFKIDGVSYTLQLTGFSTTPGGAILPDFISEERATNTAYLYGKLTAVADTQPVPEPMTLTGLSLLGAYLVTNRRKQAVKVG